jgi:hypothetical protein
VGLLGYVRKLLADDLDRSIFTRLQALEMKVEDHERLVKNIRLEWNETFDKIDHANRRIAKRARDAGTESAGSLPGEDPRIPASWPEPLKVKMRRRLGIGG